MRVRSEPDAWKNAGWTVPKSKGGTDLVAFRNEIVQQFGELHKYIATLRKENQEVTEEMQAEIAGLQKEKHVFADRLHEIEDELAGSKAANETMKATLRRKDQEIAGLQKTVQSQAHQTSVLRQELAVVKEEQRDQKSKVHIQQKLLQKTTRREALQQCLEQEREKKRGLEEELAQARAAIRTKQANIVMPSALVAGGLFAFVTGGIGGLVVGFAGGTLASKAATDSAKCPCMTDLHAELASVEERLRLVEEEIKRLENKLKPKDS